MSRRQRYQIAPDGTVRPARRPRGAGRIRPEFRAELLDVPQSVEGVSDMDGVRPGMGWDRGPEHDIIWPYSDMGGGRRPRNSHRNVNQARCLALPQFRGSPRDNGRVILPVLDGRRPTPSASRTWGSGPRRGRVTSTWHHARVGGKSSLRLSPLYHLHSLFHFWSSVVP
jgi:hypothetical protein